MQRSDQGEVGAEADDEVEVAPGEGRREQPLMIEELKRAVSCCLSFSGLYDRATTTRRRDAQRTVR